MDDRPFRDKARKPTAEAVADVLGGTARFHGELVRLVAGFEQEWNHSKSSGWMLKVHDGKKALFYLLPLAGSFRVTLTVRPAERSQLAKDPELEAAHESLRTAKKYAEGYALRFAVTDASSFAGFAAFIRRVMALRKRARG